MSNERERRCADCSTLASTSASFCIQCGGSSLTYLRYMAAPAIVCTRCGARIDAGEAWHSREAGKALCGSCKQKEEEANR